MLFRKYSFSLIILNVYHQRKITKQDDCKENTMTNIFILCFTVKYSAALQQWWYFPLSGKSSFILPFYLFIYLFWLLCLSTCPLIQLVPLRCHWYIYRTPVISIHLHNVPIAQTLMMCYMSSTFCRSDIPSQSAA